MILSNVEIVAALKAKAFVIENLAGLDPAQSPFNTSAVDLRLADEILVPNLGQPAAFDLRKPGLATFLANNSKSEIITADRPYILKQGKFILGRTRERVDFPSLLGGDFCFSARVEGKSSLARCGLIIHFTAPTIHAGFNGTITLEMINFGPLDFMLFPDMFICQLIIEQVKGIPVNAPSQFLGQDHPSGISRTERK